MKSEYQGDQAVCQSSQEQEEILGFKPWGFWLHYFTQLC